MKDDIMLELDKLMKRMKKMKVDDINSNYKDEHRGFGWLNAQEWFDLVGCISVIICVRSMSWIKNLGYKLIFINWCLPSVSCKLFTFNFSA